MASSSTSSKDADLYKKVPPRIEATNSRELGMQVVQILKKLLFFFQAQIDNVMIDGSLLELNNSDLPSTATARLSREVH